MGFTICIRTASTGFNYIALLERRAVSLLYVGMGIVSHCFATDFGHLLAAIIWHSSLFRVSTINFRVFPSQSTLTIPLATHQSRFS